jgi:hypothetical protein
MERIGLGEIGYILTKAVINIFKRLQDERKSNLYLSLLDLEYVFPTKNKFLLVAKSEFKETDLLG